MHASLHGGRSTIEGWRHMPPYAGTFVLYHVWLLWIRQSRIVRGKNYHDFVQAGGQGCAWRHCLVTACAMPCRKPVACPPPPAPCTFPAVARYWWQTHAPCLASSFFTAGKIARAVWSEACCAEEKEGILAVQTARNAISGAAGNHETCPLHLPVPRTPTPVSAPPPAHLPVPMQMPFCVCMSSSRAVSGAARPHRASRTPPAQQLCLNPSPACACSGVLCGRPR